MPIHYIVIRYPQQMVQMAFCGLLHKFHKQVTNDSQHVFVILLWRILTSTPNYYLYFRQPYTKTVSYKLFYKRHYLEPDKLTYLPESVSKCYRKYYHDFIGSDIQRKLEELFYEERCLVQLDAHWMSVFVKEGHIAVCSISQ